MRRLSTVGCVSLLLALALSPAAMADPSWATVSIELTNAQYENVSNLAVDYSGSWATVRDSLSNSDSDSMLSGTTHTTTASADIGTVSGHAETGYLHVSAGFTAAPPPGVTSYGEWNRAYQEWTFQATADGYVKFLFDLSWTVDLQTALPGEQASVTASKMVWLFNLTNYNGVGGGTGPNITRTDGDDFSMVYSQPDGIQLYFSEGDCGYLTMDVRAYGSANTVAVPVPPAILLGLLGLSTAGWRLRRHLDGMRTKKTRSERQTLLTHSSTTTL